MEIRPSEPRAAALALALLFGVVAPGCRLCAKPDALARASLETPAGTVRAFGAYMKSGLHDLEYGCFSYGFKERHGLSLFTYAQGRAELARSQPWLEFFASPKILGERALGPDRHDVDVRVAGRTYRVNLVREERFQISAGDELLAEEFVALAEVLEVEPDARGGPELVARLPLASADIDLSRASSVVLRREWRIDGVGPLDSSD